MNPEEENKKREEWVETETRRECEDCKKEIVHECQEDINLNERQKIMQEEDIKKRKEWVETENGRECED